MKKELTTTQLIFATSTLQILAKENPLGFTVNKKTFKPITKGYAIAVIETQDSFGTEGLVNVVLHADKHAYIDAIGAGKTNARKRTNTTLTR